MPPGRSRKKRQTKQERENDRKGAGIRRQRYLLFFDLYGCNAKAVMNAACCNEIQLSH